ncbi:NfeD family protein [Desulfovibrio inopinatus]|uniref:NfeD family protein n=1 Tax=Desulfovibrio inopinatus TaxID=102109 RepID=UPI00041E82AE|nr:NfeD family protein [Desulfovibrio inopinatus]
MSDYLIWFLVGTAFLIAEMMMPGFIVIFFGIGAWTTALFSALFSTGLEVELAIFITSSLLALFGLRRFFLRTFSGVSKPAPDRYIDEIVGKTAQVTKKIGPHHRGEVKFRGSYWQAVADTQLVPGDDAIILGQSLDDSLTLEVTPASRIQTEESLS